MLIQIQSRIDDRVSATRNSRADWPCAKGCDDCCRSLASEPLLSEPEWLLLQSALTPLLCEKIEATANAPRPVTCPLLELSTGACLVYEVRPLACRTYGYYAERDKVLGCYRIESIAAANDTILWGNQAAVERDAATLGPMRPLSQWVKMAAPYTEGSSL